MNWSRGRIRIRTSTLSGNVLDTILGREQIERVNRAETNQ